VSFASGLGAEIIAEGIETPAELEMRAFGIRYGQGFLLCRATSVELIPSRLPREVWSAATTWAS
jgi:EAL domain-containing protein (putative c-di-GMP-specific phosphodiesterase class I)